MRAKVVFFRLVWIFRVGGKNLSSEKEKLVINEETPFVWSILSELPSSEAIAEKRHPPNQLTMDKAAIIKNTYL